MLHVSENKCVGCGLCVGVCPEAAIALKAGVAQVDKDKCIECRSCLQQCPQQAISFLKDINLVVAFGTDDGKNLKRDDHVGMSKYFKVYRFYDGREELIEQRENAKYKEDETKVHGDPGKAKATASALESVDILIGRMFGPNITRLKDKFVCGVVRENTVEDAIKMVHKNISEIIEEKNKSDRRGVILK